MITLSLPELLGAIAGFILSVVAEFVPAYQSLDEQKKRLVMAVALVIAAGASYGLSCVSFIAVFLVQLFPNAALTCDQAGLSTLLGALFAALTVNQSTHALLKRSKK